MQSSPQSEKVWVALLRSLSGSDEGIIQGFTLLQGRSSRIFPLEGACLPLKKLSECSYACHFYQENSDSPGTNRRPVHDLSVLLFCGNHLKRTKFR